MAENISTNDERAMRRAKRQAMLDAGVAYATEQIIDLFANGINAVHIYTMNKPEVATRIMSNLHNIIGH